MQAAASRVENSSQVLTCVMKFVHEIANEETNDAKWTNLNIIIHGKGTIKVLWGSLILPYYAFVTVASHF